jgi:hypothetical protein
MSTDATGCLCFDFATVNETPQRSRPDRQRRLDMLLENKNR